MNRSCVLAWISLWVALGFPEAAWGMPNAFPPGHGPGRSAVQEPVPSGNQVETLVQTLEGEGSAEVRRSAAEALGVVGTPKAIDALRKALNEDRDSTVRVAAATSLGRGGASARRGIPDLIRALDRTGTDGSVCLSSAGALGALGHLSIAAIRPLANAAISGCGRGSEVPLRSLAAIASDVSGHAAAYSTSELEEIYNSFSEAKEELGLVFPPALLEGIRGEIRSRGTDWVSEGAGLLAVVGGTVVSAGRTVGRFLAAFLGVLLVGFGLRYARRWLTHSPPPQPGKRAFGWEWAEVEIWLKRPKGRFPRRGLPPSHISSFLRDRAKERGIPIPGEMDSLEEEWEQFARTAGGGSVPGFAASKWTESVLSDLQGGRTPSPPGSILDVVLGEIDARFVPDPSAPPREMVHRVVQAVAWETMKEGGFSGWVEVDDLHAGAPGELVEIVLDYADEEMEILNWDRSKKRVELPLEEELVARLGGFHLLKHEASSGGELVKKISELQAGAIQAVGPANAPEFLRTVACALLDAAAGLDPGGGQDLGVAEIALKELAGVGHSWGSEPPEAETLESEALGIDLNRGATDPKVDRLVQRLGTETNPGVRERIIRALGELGPQAESALPALVRSVEKDPRGVAAAAVAALGELGPVAQTATPLLLNTLETGSPAMQMAAAGALGRLGEAGADAAPVLLEWTSREGIPHELRVRATEALGSIPSAAQHTIPSLRELLQSGVAEEVRAAAALALGRLDSGSPEVQAALRAAENSSDPLVKGMAGIALLVRKQRLTGTRPTRRRDGGWLAPLVGCAVALSIVQFGAVMGSQFLNPGDTLPALILTPALALLAGVAYGVATYRQDRHPALGGGVSAFLGASAGILFGFLIAPGLTPVVLAIGGTLATGSGAVGGTLARTALVTQ